MSKVVKVNDLIKKLKSEKRVVALSHGVFDLIHHGHLRHFEEIKKKVIYWLFPLHPIDL